MFFTISKNPDDRFVNHDCMGSWWFSHDNGWSLLSSSNADWIKGYCTPDQMHGNYTHIKFDSGIVKLTHDLCRSYPLWWNETTQTLTNLLGTGRPIWADTTVKLTEDNLIEDKIDPIGNIDLSLLTVDQAVEEICQNLKNKVTSLNYYDENIQRRLFVSGGIDTLTLLALIKNTNLSCDILDYEHFEYDQFTNQNLANIQNSHWAYKQLHHWCDNIMLISGACGDEFLFRGPCTIALWAAWHDINLAKILETASGYHVGYFCKPSNLDIIKDHWQRRETIKSLYPTKESLVRQILNTNVNDHQHWHLGNTLTWTPFKDLTLTKIMMRLSESYLLDHILDASVNKKVIDKLWPSALHLLSATKNTNSRQYLHNLYDI